MGSVRIRHTGSRTTTMILALVAAMVLGAGQASAFTGTPPGSVAGTGTLAGCPITLSNVGLASNLGPGNGGDYTVEPADIVFGGTCAGTTLGSNATVEMRPGTGASSITGVDIRTPTFLNCAYGGNVTGGSYDDSPPPGFPNLDFPSATLNRTGGSALCPATVTGPGQIFISGTVPVL